MSQKVTFVNTDFQSSKTYYYKPICYYEVYFLSKQNKFYFEQFIVLLVLNINKGKNW